MAKKKTEAPTVENPAEVEQTAATQEAQTQETVETPANEEEAKVETPANEETSETPNEEKTDEAPKEAATTGKKAKENKAKTEIPQAVHKILKLFPNEKALYVDTYGGVFTADTKPSEIGTAILYQNPYYKS